MVRAKACAIWGLELGPRRSKPLVWGLWPIEAKTIYCVNPVGLLNFCVLQR